jgi:DHA2 family lincomycin resistance protein-like MFS transporter
MNSSPGSDELSPRESRVIWLLLVAAFVAVLSEMTMAMAIPHLMSDFGITAASAQWLTTAFMLTMAVIIPISGFLLRRFSIRQVFTAGMCLFSSGTILALIAPEFLVLIVARVVQAAGTAIMIPLLMTTMIMMVPRHAQGRMMGRVNAVLSLAPASGPILSGFLLDTVGWRWIFGVVAPISLVALAIGARWLTNLGETTRNRIDVLSVVLSAFGFGGIVYGLSQVGGASSHGAGAPAGMPTFVPLIAAFVVGLGALFLFGWRQVKLQHNDSALIDLRVFRSKNFTLSIAHLALISLAYLGTLTILPLYLQNVLGISALDAGLVILPGALIVALIGPLAGRMYDRWGTRVLLVPGAVIVTGLLWYLSTVDSNTPIWKMVVAYTGLSIGFGISYTPLFAASLGSLKVTLYSYGSAVVGTVQQIAGAVGIALLVTLMSTVTEDAADAGMSVPDAGASGVGIAFLIASAASAIGVVIAWLIRKPSHQSERQLVAH